MSYGKLIIAGSRTFNNYQLLEESILAETNNLELGPTEIVSGMAKGADRLGELFAGKHNIKVAYYPANWALYGKKAGFLRNKEMAEYADSLIAFWDGYSSGTKNMIELAYLNNLKTKIIMFHGPSTIQSFE